MHPLTLAQTIRAGEVTLMMGFPAAAGMYAMTAVSGDSCLRLVLVVAALTPVAFSIYAYNALSGLSGDGKDPKFSNNPIHNGTVSAGHLHAVTWIGCALGLAASALLSWAMAAAVVVLWLLWMAYSHPRGLKGLAGAGSAVHVAGGMLLFLIPYAMMRPIDGRGLWLAAIFAVAFASGHSNHEILDQSADASAGLRTFAVVFGSRWSWVMGILLAATAYLLAAAAWRFGALTAGEAIPLMTAAPFHLGAALTAGGKAPDRVWAQRFRSCYRTVFALAVLVSLFAHLRSIIP